MAQPRGRQPAQLAGPGNHGRLGGKPDRIVKDANGKYYCTPGHHDKFYEIP
ncbi:hypothetical protein [Amycolatopsis sp. cmx-11-32]|uniref:hypothetical protein n=1 Tax=Amycolatopsis sp. cmx-11-32 TaxID=2785796 RepID=UPI0039E67939